MKNSMYWLLAGLVVVVINLGAIPISAFSLFGTAEGTSIFSIDYLIAFAILFIPNIVTISLFVSIRKQNVKAFFIGVGLAIVEALVMMSIFFGVVESIVLCAVLIGLCAVGGIILIVKSIFVPSTKLAN